MTWPDLRDSLEHAVARTCLAVIRLVCRRRDESLSAMIHRTADRYARRPERRWG